MIDTETGEIIDAFTILLDNIDDLNSFGFLLAPANDLLIAVYHNNNYEKTALTGLNPFQTSSRKLEFYIDLIRPESSNMPYFKLQNIRSFSFEDSLYLMGNQRDSSDSEYIGFLLKYDY